MSLGFVRSDDDLIAYLISNQLRLQLSTMPVVSRLNYANNSLIPDPETMNLFLIESDERSVIKTQRGKGARQQPQII